LPITRRIFEGATIHRACQARFKYDNGWDWSAEPVIQWSTAWPTQGLPIVHGGLKGQWLATWSAWSGRGLAHRPDCR